MGLPPLTMTERIKKKKKQPKKPDDAMIRVPLSEPGYVILLLS